SSRADCLFLTWQWLHTWWTHLGEGRRLFIVAVRSDSQLIALAPLTMTNAWTPRTLEFLGTGSVGSDYLDFIVDPAHETLAVHALTEFIAAAGCSIRLPSVREDSIVASVVSRTLRERGWRFRKVAMQICPFINLS